MNDGLNTPYFSATGSLMAEEQTDMGEVGDWTNYEAHPRDPNCVLEYGCLLYTSPSPRDS